MENTREAIAKIEATLGAEIEAAALKRDLNKMVLALTDSVKNLVVIAKDVADKLEAFTVVDGKVTVTGELAATGNVTAYDAKPTRAKKPAAKKPAPKRTQKQPIQPK